MMAGWKYNNKKFILQQRANTNLKNFIDTIKEKQKQQNLPYYCPSFVVDHLLLCLLRTLHCFDELNICSGDIKNENVLFYYYNPFFGVDILVINWIKVSVL